MSDTSGLSQLLNDRLMVFEDGDWAVRTQLENDTEFERPQTGPWITQDLQMIPPRNIGAFVAGGEYRLQGNYELTVNVPLGEGLVEGRALADKLVKHFFRGLILNEGSKNVKVERSFQSGKVTGASYVSLPVTIEFWSYSPYSPNAEN